MSLRKLKTERKKAEIIQSAIQIIAEKGFHATTMEDIAATLLMTKGSIYYYFKDKQDLLYQSQVMVLEQSIENISKVLNEPLQADEKLKKAMQIHVDYLISERFAFGMGSRPEQFFEGEQLEAILQLRDRYSEYFEQMVHEGIEQNIFDSSLNVKIARNLALGAMNWIIDWYKPKGVMGKEELASLAADYLLKIFYKTSDLQ